MKYPINTNLTFSRGFTIIELIIVIALIGILSSFILVNLIGVREKGRDARRKYDLGQIQAAVELYRSDKGFYPPSGTFDPCSGTFIDGTTTYMQKKPCDPSTGFGYTYNLVGTGYEIIACLENLNDPLKDPPPSRFPCNGTSNWSYTVTNP